MPENLLVLEAVSQVEQRILNDEFGHNGLFHRRMEQCRNSRSGLPPSFCVNVIPTHLHMFKLSSPQAFINEFVIAHKEQEHGGGGTDAYLRKVFGMERSVVHDVNHSRFSAPLFLE